MSSELAVRSQVATERCPWCGSTISREKFDEIAERIAEEERFVQLRKVFERALRERKRSRNEETKRMGNG